MALTFNQVTNLLSTLQNVNKIGLAVSFLIPEGFDIEGALQHLRKLDYWAFVRSTEFGQEIVVTDYVGHADT